MTFAQTVNGIGGPAGWVGAGLLGCVLAWLLFVHLPAKDKLLTDFLAVKGAQIERLLEQHRQEREADRQLILAVLGQIKALLVRLGQGGSGDGGGS